MLNLSKRIAAHFYSAGAAQDYGAALSWFEKAAEADNKYVCINLTKMYKQRPGVEKDDSVAKYWLDMADTIKGN